VRSATVRDEETHLWATYWAEEKRRRRRRRRRRRERRGDRTQLVYDTAIVIAGVSGIAAVFHAVVVGLSG
jgi:hypothetical protein